MLTDELLKSFYAYMPNTYQEGQPAEVLNKLTADLTGFGPGADEIMWRPDDSRPPLAVQIAQADGPLTISYDVVEPTRISDDVGVVMCVFNLSGTRSGQPLVFAGLRLSAIFKRSGGDWLLTHAHLSLPHEEQEAEREKSRWQTAVLAEQVQRLRALLENLPGMAYRCRYDRDWTMLFISEGCEALTGYAPEMLINSQEVAFADLIVPEDREMVAEKVSAGLAAHAVFELTYRIRTRDDEVRWVWEQGRGVFDESGTVRFLEGFVQDVTPRREAETSLQETVVELEQSNRDLQQFAYAASHDLQEPLRMVTSFLEMLQLKYQDDLDEEAHTFIDFALDGAQRMRLLINGLLNYARVDTRGQPFTAVDMADVFEKVALNVQMSLAETNGRLEITTPLPVVFGDRSQLIQLLQNIVSNAIKYRSDAPPLIEVSCEEVEDVYHFTIRDNGIGIDPKHHERVFVIFQRLHTSEEYAGSGLGLAVCKRIVDRHNGRIWVESAPGEGSAFHVTLPPWRPADAETA